MKKHKKYTHSEICDMFQKVYEYWDLYPELQKEVAKQMVEEMTKNFASIDQIPFGDKFEFKP